LNVSVLLFLLKGLGHAMTGGIFTGVEVFRAAEVEEGQRAALMP